MKNAHDAIADFNARISDIVGRAIAIKQDAMVLGLDVENYAGEIEQALPSSLERDKFIASLNTMKIALIRLASLPHPRG